MPYPLAMYAPFFGLRQDPFSIAPDPRYLFMSERHREALAHLLYGVGGGGGFVLLSGEIGTGKTTVCRCFLEQIPGNCRVAYIFNPKLTAVELLSSVCAEFHIDLPPSSATAKDFIDPLNAFLLAGHAASQNHVLIIDEAQNLSADLLEQLRLLTNLETNERKLLQIVLIGQPELRNMLARPELEQMAQRVMARFHLDALTRQESGDYIAHRMAVAGLQGVMPFDAKALARVHQLSRGVPRRINLLCGRALLGAYATGVRQVSTTIVDKAALEVFGPRLAAEQRRAPVSRKVWGWGTAALVTLMAVFIGTALGGGLGGGLSGIFGGGELMSRLKIWALPKTAPAVVMAPAAVPVPVPLPVLTLPVIKPAIPRLAEPVLSEAAFLSQLRSHASDQAKLAPKTSQNLAWQALASKWGASLSEADLDKDLCKIALLQGLRCFSNRQNSVPVLRSLNRPGIITLSTDTALPSYALLLGLEPDSATLSLGSSTFRVALDVLVKYWRGDFATLWRVQHAADDSNPEWLNAQLSLAENSKNTKNIKDIHKITEKIATNSSKTPAAADLNPSRAPVLATLKLTTSEALRSRIYAFQLAQGLSPDGRAGPMTLMQLSRATGMDEPRLQAELK